MKKIVALGVTTLIGLSSLGVSAAEMGGSMMMNSDMNMSMSSGMMNTSMQMSTKLKPMTTIAIAKWLGYSWKSDRKMLAQMAGISGYRGTYAQNIKLRTYLVQVASEGVMVGGASMVKTRDIVDNAVRANNVTTVVAAVKAAGLVDTLKSAGPFTVFAPDNAAFAKLPAGTVETLVKPENKATLVDILTYHVVAGRYTTADLKDGMELTTVEGKKLMIKKDATGKIWINGSAMIETADVISTNGVTHVIDTVLMPTK